MARAPVPDRVPVVLTSRTLASYVSARRAAARALAELGVPAFFVAGTAYAVLGPSAPRFILVVVLLSLVLRRADVEARPFEVPGGTTAAVRAALGPRVARIAASALLVERLALGALAAVLGGQYVMALAGAVVGPPAVGAGAESGPFALALVAIGVAWLLNREGRIVVATPYRAVGMAVAAVAVLVVWAFATALSHVNASSTLPHPWTLPGATWFLAHDAVFGWLRPDIAVAALVAFGLGHTLAALGGAEALRGASFLIEEPRAANLGRVARLVGAFGLLVIVPLGFLYADLVPAAEGMAWASAPLAGLALHLAAPGWLRLLALAAITAAAVVFLWATHRAVAASAIGTVGRLADEGVLDHEWREPHHRFGTPWRIVDAVGIMQVGIVLVSGAQVAWLARVYGLAVACSTVLYATALVRRRIRDEGRQEVGRSTRQRVQRRAWLAAVAAATLAVAGAAVALMLALDGPTLAASGLVATLSLALAASERRRSRRAAAGTTLERFPLLSSPDVDRREVGVRPGGLLVPVRNPHTLVHLSAALRAAGDRDVVAMTVRLLGVDVAEDAPPRLEATEEERHLLSAVVAAAEREGRSVRLLIVPGANVLDTIIDTALRLEASEIHVGESATLSADEQARLAGQAWERAARPQGAAVRVVVHHARGDAQAYQLGAHAPRLEPEDFDRIHRLWLDAVKSVGAHVHHRDVVRAALTRMEQELNGPDRDAVLQVVRETARPADAVAAIIRERDFGRLRDVLRNRPPNDLASILSGLSLEDRVLVFRILPRKAAADTFAYLSTDEQNGLLRAMASEEAAAVLNDMPPDDRTTFLEELPAEATRQLLALLTPGERAEAVRLLGYPEHSVGRLMTSHYVSVREGWTIAEVLEYVRLHGEDSETLNVLYVVDDKGLLIDDIRIREILLTAPTNTVSQLMDRRFVALRAADDQEDAVRVFRAEDRTALPVTDSTGVLIGIVTVDDVLDVAEQEATEDLQRFGGSEALDEPYMQVRFLKMVQKRAGWLTALFLGEMLTATAMGAFEREIERAVVLALFVPLIISSGGNSGSQASTLVIRALALGEVRLRDWWQVMRREFAAGLALGGILGGIGFLRITVWSAFSTIYGPHWFLVALTVALALVGIVLWGTLVGSLLPFGLRRLGFDPAASSAPFVATLVDVTGLVIYFSVGMVVLRGTLL